MTWLTAIIPLNDIQNATGQTNGEILYAASKYMHFYMRTNKIKSKRITNYLICSMYFQFIAGLEYTQEQISTIDISKFSKNVFKDILRYNYNNYIEFNFNKYYVPIYLIPILDIFIQMKCSKFIKEVYNDFIRYYGDDKEIVVNNNCLRVYNDTNIIHAITVNILEKNYKYWCLARCLTYNISIYDL